MKGPEQLPEESPIREFKVSYELKDSYGRVYGTGTSGDLGDIPPGATEFDGYIETPVGSFAFQGPIEKARKLLSNITEWTAVQKEVQKLDREYWAAMRERDSAAEVYRQKDDSSWLKRVDTTIARSQEELVWKKARLHNLEIALAPYRI